MNKCSKCIWSDKIDNNHVFCMLPKCIRKIKKVNENDQVILRLRWSLLVMNVKEKV
jgi:hypothetical protein